MANPAFLIIVTRLLLRPAPLKALGYLSDVTIVMAYQHPTFLVPLLMMDL